MAEGLVVLLSLALPLMGGPGPATLSCAAAGSAFGVRRGLWHVAGICTGNTVVIIMIATGVTGLI